ncbi:hypothetical protein KM043_001039 [Ampulex compressa]|nr:hypothetical protein KM043_001039 [Ampulex compressa]
MGSFAVGTTEFFTRSRSESLVFGVLDSKGFFKKDGFSLGLEVHFSFLEFWIGKVFLKPFASSSSSGYSR